jgi:hypothetical protein
MRAAAAEVHDALHGRRGDRVCDRLSEPILRGGQVRRRMLGRDHGVHGRCACECLGEEARVGDVARGDVHAGGLECAERFFVATDDADRGALREKEGGELGGDIAVRAEQDVHGSSLSVRGEVDGCHRARRNCCDKVPVP